MLYVIVIGIGGFDTLKLVVYVVENFSLLLKTFCILIFSFLG